MIKKLQVDPRFQEAIDKHVLENNEDREPSGRLSAGRLGWPLQWQMLWYYKVQPKGLDAYTLRKFQRGNDVEDRIVEWINPARKQEPVTYRGIPGIMDFYDEMPVEVKSVTNMAFKYIQKGGAKPSHKLQGEFYAKALGEDEYEILYVASDDYRVLTFKEKVTDNVDRTIDEFEAQVKLGEVPEFEAKEKWQEHKDYNMYPDWMKLTKEEIQQKLKEEHDINIRTKTK